MDSKMKRIHGTVKEPVEKFVAWNEKEETGWGKTKARVDLAAIALFTELWVLTTYKKKRLYEKQQGNFPRAVWENLDGSRSLQYTVCVRFPAGFDDRCFDSWITWDVRAHGDGRKEYIIVLVPIDEYKGRTRHKLKGTEKMKAAWTRGVFIVRELTENTCEWTRVQQVNLKVSLPKPVMDMLTKNELGMANRFQEEYRRNGNDVDKETRLAIAKIMKERRGVPLTADQEVRMA